MKENVLIKAAVVTVSDSRTMADDTSGQRLVDSLQNIGAIIIVREIVTDDLEKIVQTLRGIIDAGDVNLLITTGGTGFAPRDNTPEATRAVIERETPGISEAMRIQTFAKTPLAMLSRGISGIRGKCLIINFPGSPKGVSECFEIIKPVLNHAVNLISGYTKHND